MTQKIVTTYFELWREDLGLILRKFQAWHLNTRFYFLKIFVFFVFINDAAYWFAIGTAYPEIFAGKELEHYIKVQIPVALLGALFDSLSLYITLVVVRRALLSRSNFSYISHLSIDILIAIAATFWVLFVFSISGWIVSFMPTETIVKTNLKANMETNVKTKKQVAVKPESLKARNKVYKERAIAAVKNPTGKEEMRNIYFGIVMGFSAIIPTCVHIISALFSLRFYLKYKYT
jgi:hypothetical protein